MGWCSATEIIDAAIAGAEAAVKHVLAEFAPPGNEQPYLDAVLSPFVKTIAEHLNDGDWDCHGESAYYDRFAQEMHDDTDEEYMDRLAEELAEEITYEGVTTDRYRQLVARIKRHSEKMRKARHG